MAGTDTEIDGVELEGGELTLVKALRAGKVCKFEYNGPKALPESQRTVRGDVLGKILRSENLGSERKAFKLPRNVHIYGAFIKGKLDMSDTDTGLVLSIRHSRFDSEVNFSRAKLVLLDLNHSELVGIEMQFIMTASHLWLIDVKNEGPLNIVCANIGGQLAISSKNRQTRLKNPSGKAINAQGAKIEQGVFLRGAYIEGYVGFTGAKINGPFSAVSISAYTTTFRNLNRVAISAQGAQITNGVFLSGAQIEGRVLFIRTKIGGQFVLKNTKIISLRKSALSLQGAEIKDLLWLANMAHPVLGDIDLNGASLSRIAIDDYSYPLGRIILDGTTYTNLFNPNQNAGNQKAHKIAQGWLLTLSKDQRKKRFTNASKPQARGKDDLSNPMGYWPAFASLCISLAKDGEIYLPQTELKQEAKKAMNNVIVRTHTRTPFAYRQFASVLDTNGHEREARKIRILAAKAFTERTVLALYPNWKRTPAKILRWCLRKSYRGWRSVLRRTTGYGEHLQYAAYWLLALLIVGTISFEVFTPDMVPAKERFYMTADAYNSWKSNGTLPEAYPKFNPFLYALDVMLPIVDIGQESHWRPKNVDRWWNGPRIYNHLHLAMGWFLSTIGIAGLTGLLKDKRE